MAKKKKNVDLDEQEMSGGQIFGRILIGGAGLFIVGFIIFAVISNLG